jgi:hypothetical protein
MLLLARNKGYCNSTSIPEHNIHQDLIASTTIQHALAGKKKKGYCNSTSIAEGK